MGISIWQLLVILSIIVLVFGTKKFRTIGSDLGSAIRSFKLATKSENSNGDDITKNEKP